MKNYNTLLCAGLAFATVSQVVAYPLQEVARSVTSKTSVSIPFQQKPRMPKSSLRKRQDTNPNDDQTILGNENDVRYIASIVIAGEPLDVVIDSGSTDTFVFSVQPDGLQNLPASELPPLFDNSTAMDVIDTGLTYNASYGGGNGVTSTLYSETLQRSGPHTDLSVYNSGAIQLAPVSINGTDLQANNLTFANLYSSSSPTGASGLLGLGFPFNGAIYLTILEAFEAANQPLTTEETQRFFPLVPLLEYQGKIDQALFSIVVDRLDSTAPLTADNQFDTVFSNGTLTFGGYPEGYQQSDFAFSSVPVVQFNERGQSIGLPSSTGNRWTLPLEAIYFNGQQLANTTAQTDYYTDGEVYYALIDTGNPSMSFPTDIMDQIIPSGAWAGNPNNRVIDCNTQFDLTLQFAGQKFPLSTQDLLVPSYLAVDSLGYGGFAQDQCQFQAQPAPPTPDEIGPGTSITYQLGDPFLRNVAAVFNYGNILNSLQTPPMIGLAGRK